MLPASAAVQDVYLNPDIGILAGLNSIAQDTTSTLCIDSTTLDRADAIEVANQVSSSSSAQLIDAPVSGGQSLLPFRFFFYHQPPLLYIAQRKFVCVCF